MNNKSILAFISIALATLACAISLPGPGTLTPEDITPAPTITSTSTDSPLIQDGGASAVLLEDVDLVQLYNLVNPGVVTIWRWAGSTS